MWKILLLLCSFFFVSHAQSSALITEPRLTSINPLNSTALTVNWQFANASVDQSDLITISIVIYEFYFTHRATYGPFNYTFSSSNKSITSLTQNFEWVNAYYYVCFSSNSTKLNTTQFVAVTNDCRLVRTCARSNRSCAGPSSTQVISTNITASSFTIVFLWPIDLPYTPLNFAAQLINNGPSGTTLTVTQNDSFIIRPYLFTNLQARTSYSVNTSVTFNILNSAAQTNLSILTVTTSRAATQRRIDRWTSIFSFYPVIASLFLQIK